MGLLEALGDGQFRTALARGLTDAANRGAIGGLLGAPIDAAASAINLPLMAAGYLGNKAGLLSADQMPQPITSPVGGSEWIGQRMQDAGLVSGERNPLAEALASVAVPGAMVRGARALPVVEADGLLGLMLRPRAGSAEAQAGAIYPAGKARLLQDLEARQPSGRYQLGDVTEGQGKGLDALFGRESPTRDVFMTDDAFRHIVERRMSERGFSPADVARFVEEAMARRARPDLDVSKSLQNPSLLGPAFDAPTGRNYSARLPLKSVDDGYEVRSVIAEGLPPRNNKAPKR